jgi:hypothetical protein
VNAAINNAIEAGKASINGTGSVECAELSLFEVQSAVTKMYHARELLWTVAHKFQGTP